MDLNFVLVLAGNCWILQSLGVPSADISLSDVARKPNEGLVSGSKRLVHSIVLDVSRGIGKVLVAEVDEVEKDPSTT